MDWNDLDDRARRSEMLALMTLIVSLITIFVAIVKLFL